MKKQTLFKMVLSHYKGDEKIFLKASRELVRDLNDMGEKNLAIEINKVIQQNNKVTISNHSNIENFILSKYLEKTLKIIEKSFIENQIQKVYLHGLPGTGKTIFSEIIARKINIPIKKIRLSQIIDSRLGESMRLLDQVFLNKERILIFIDEVDSIASHRFNGNDVFEINRVLNHFLQLLDNLNRNKMVVVATNLVEQIDSALTRRFDISINFNNYQKDDIEKIFLEYQENFELYKFASYDENLKKLILSTHNFWTPAYIKRVIKESMMWLSNDESPKQQVLEILRLIKIGHTRETIKNKLIELKTPLRVIDYFLGRKNEKNNSI